MSMSKLISSKRTKLANLQQTQLKKKEIMNIKRQWQKKRGNITIDAIYFKHI